MLVKIGALRSTSAVGKTYYLSSVAANGYAIGNNSNSGLTKAAPLLTFAAAQTAAADGDTIIINGTAAAPFTYSGILALTKSLTWRLDPALSVGDVILSSTSTTTRCVDINGPGKTIVLDGLKLDADLAVGAESGLIQMISNAATAPVDFTMRNCLLADWTIGRGIFMGSGGVKGNILIEDCEFTTAGLCESGIELNTMISGSVTLRRNVINLSNQNFAGKGGVLIRCHSTAAAGAVRASVTDNVVDVLWYSGGAFTGANVGLYIENVADADVARNTVAMGGAFTDGSARDSQGEGIVIQTNSSVQLQSGGFLIDDNDVTVDAKNGMGIRIGRDDAAATTPGLLDAGFVRSRGVVSNNRIAGTANSESILHGVFLNRTDAIAEKNVIDRAGLGIGDKQADGVLVANNVIKRAAIAHIRLKGSQNGIYRHNTAVLTTGYDGAGIDAVQNGTTGVNCAAGVIEANMIVRDGGAGQYASIDASQDAALASNTYHAEGGGTPANPWAYHGASYANLAAWRAIEATADATDPGLTGYPGSLVPTTAATVARDADVLTDFNGASRNDPTAVGAYEDA